MPSTHGAKDSVKNLADVQDSLSEVESKNCQMLAGNVLLDAQDDVRYMHANGKRHRLNQSRGVQRFCTQAKHRSGTNSRNWPVFWTAKEIVRANGAGARGRNVAFALAVAIWLVVGALLCPSHTLRERAGHRFRAACGTESLQARIPRQTGRRVCLFRKSRDCPVCFQESSLRFFYTLVEDWQHS